MKINHSFQINSLLKMITPPPPHTHTHFLENYFAEVKIKNDHMIDKMEDRVKLTNRNYSAILATLQITSYALGVYIALLFTCQLHESLIKLYFKQFSIFQLKF